MKRALLLAFALLAISPAMMAKKDPPAPTTAAPEEIHWITNIDELQAKMMQSPKKVLVDMYTGWCGWCKKMDADTYSNPALVKYVNNNYYAVKLDAERRDTIHFQGRDFFFAPEYKTNGFALELLKDYLAKGGQMSYPQTIFMLENFQSPTPVPGYRTVPEMETFLTYFGDNMFRRQSWDQYSKGYVSRWSKGTPAPAAGAPAGH
jgi:thioredoxin-related protein